MPLANLSRIIAEQRCEVRVKVVRIGQSHLNRFVGKHALTARNCFTSVGWERPQTAVFSSRWGYIVPISLHAIALVVRIVEPQRFGFPRPASSPRRRTRSFRTR